ncbi:MAG: hypothetical protein R3E67_03890 [Pseudomonadales bacterium]
MSSNEPERIAAVNEYAPKEVAELDLYQKREKIYTRSIEGFFQRIRLFTGWPLLVGYFFLPWTQWHGHQTVLFDLPARKFYIFDLVFWPQDLVLLAWTLIIAAFALFFFTSLFGRIWCGYPARKRCGPVFSCGWSKKRKAVATSVSNSIKCRGLRKKFYAKPQNTRCG